MISKYGSQCSKGLPTTNSLVQPLHTGMVDKGAFTVYTATLIKFLPVARILQNPESDVSIFSGFCPHWSGVVGPNHHSAIFTGSFYHHLQSVERAEMLYLMQFDNTLAKVQPPLGLSWAEPCICHRVYSYIYLYPT